MLGESYVAHMGVALSFAVALLAAGLACLVHALLPFLFTSTARRTITTLHGIVTHRDRPAEAHALQEPASRRRASLICGA